MAEHPPALVVMEACGSAHYWAREMVRLGHEVKLMAAQFVRPFVSGQAMMVQEFDTAGLGQWFRYFTGSLELLGAVVVLVPRVSAFGAILLLLVDIGAFVAQITVLHMDWVHTIVTGLFIAALIYLQRHQINPL